MSIHFYFLRSRLVLPIGVLAALLSAWGGWIFFSRRPGLRAAGAVVMTAVVYPLYKSLGAVGIGTALLLFCAAVVYRRKIPAAFKTWITMWAATFVPRFKERDKEETKLNVGRIPAGLSMCVLSFFVLFAAAAFVNLMFSPL